MLEELGRPCCTWPKVNGVLVIGGIPLGLDACDYASYQRHEQTLKDLLERTLAQASAASPYFKVPPKGWNEAVLKVAEASTKPDPRAVEYACKHLRIVTEELKTVASTRELAANG